MSSPHCVHLYAVHTFHITILLFGRNRNEDVPGRREEYVRRICTLSTKRKKTAHLRFFNRQRHSLLTNSKFFSFVFLLYQHQPRTIMNSQFLYSQVHVIYGSSLGPIRTSAKASNETQIATGNIHGFEINIINASKYALLHRFFSLRLQILQ